MKQLDFYWCRQTRRSGFKVHSLPRLQPEFICHEGPAACKHLTIDSTKSTAHVNGIKVFVTGTMKRNCMFRSPQAWMSRFARPPHNIPQPCHNTPVACVTALHSSCFHSGSLWMKKQAKPWTLQTADQAQLLSPGRVHVTSRHPSGLCGIWGRLKFIVWSEPEHPCTRVLDHPAMSPLLCSGLSAPHWHSHSVR